MGYVVSSTNYNGSLLNFLVSKQATVFTTSSTETEYIALSECGEIRLDSPDSRYSPILDSYVR
eukprot:473417-Pyramimonas_sp.AAC.1